MRLRCFSFSSRSSDAHAVGGSELGEVGVDEVRVVDQFGLQLEKFVELGLGHVSVNAMGTESPAELGLQVLGHEGGQVWNAGPLETAEEVPEPIRIEVIVIQCLQSAIRDSLYAFVLTEGLVEKVVVTDGIRVELGRVGGLSSFDQPAVVEVGSQFVLEVRVGFFGVFFEVEQGLAILDFLDLARVPVALDP